MCIAEPTLIGNFLANLLQVFVQQFLTACLTVDKEKFISYTSGFSSVAVAVGTSAAAVLLLLLVFSVETDDVIVVATVPTVGEIHWTVSQHIGE